MRSWISAPKRARCNERRSAKRDARRHRGGRHRPASMVRPPRLNSTVLTSEYVPAVHDAVTSRKALFVDGQKCRIAYALPERGTIGRERLHAIGIGRENQAVAESRRKPVGQRAGNSCCERKYALAPEGAVGFLVVRIGVVARNGEQHRRHAKGQRDLARGRMLGLQKILVARR